MLVDSPAVLSEYSFGWARTQSQRLQALRLRQDVYARKGLLDHVARDCLHIAPQAFVSGSGLFIASRNGVVEGTVSIYADSDIGLPMDEVHPAEVDRMRQRVSKIAEVGGLAVAEEARNLSVTFMLYYTVFHWSRRNHFGGLVICVHPSKRVYHSLLQFEILGQITAHPRFRSAPSLPLGLEMATVLNQVHPRRGESRSKMDVRSFFCEERIPLDFPKPGNGACQQWTKQEIRTLRLQCHAPLSPIRDDIVAR
jgi:hypothetical protein